MKIKVEPPRKKKEIIQCIRCQAYGHSKTYCFKPYFCVKCGEPHNTKDCNKSSNTPARCALCNGNHPANYKGCTVYKNLQRNRNDANRRTLPNSNFTRLEIGPTTSVTNRINLTPNNNRSYAQIARADAENTDINLSHFLSKFEAMFTQLMNQNSMIINLLSSIVNSRTHNG